MRTLTSVFAAVLCACCPQEPDPTAPMPDESAESTTTGLEDLPAPMPNVCCACFPATMDLPASVSCKIWDGEPKACEALDDMHKFTQFCSADEIPLGCPGTCPI